MIHETSYDDDDDDDDLQSSSARSWIRGVNIGGWLLMERFITPYLFAITSCHIKGDFCWYPGQLSAPPQQHEDHQYCDLYNCQPHLIKSVDGLQEFPVDEWTLASSFESRAIAKQYFEYHWDNFVTLEDIKELHLAGVTHVRVPISHWIFGDIRDDEPWVDGGWLYFIRLVGWCRTLNIQVWVDIHTAPGSQNGFDNSGQLLADEPTCRHWIESEENVRRSLKVVQDLTHAIKKDGLKDVVTGIGLLNEPFADCDRKVVKQIYDDSLEIVRDGLGSATAVYISDLFNATKWQVDGFWTDEERHSNTFLDSHYYHGK
jgi:glucan 1,3-beta-glucosidase